MLNAGADVLARVLQQFLVFRGAEQAIEFLTDNKSGAAIVDLGRAVDAANQGKNRVRPKLVELRQRLFALRAPKPSRVVCDEAIDDRVELVLFLVCQLRQGGRQ